MYRSEKMDTSGNEERGEDVRSLRRIKLAEIPLRETRVAVGEVFLNLEDEGLGSKDIEPNLR